MAPASSCRGWLQPGVAGADARLIAAYKNQNPSLKIAYHCDGYIEPIIPDLIEIGLDILNPSSRRWIAEIARKYGTPVLLGHGCANTLWTAQDEKSARAHPHVAPGVG
jgi:hypothetical protein